MNASSSILLRRAAIGLLALSCASFAFASPTTALPEFVTVSGGHFTQGSTEQPFSATEKVHEATVSSFMIATTETPQNLWTEVIGSNPSGFKGDTRPVENVTWLDVVRFCNALSAKEGLEAAYTIAGDTVTWKRGANGYRLPTEAEWEFAARGGVNAASGPGPLSRAPYSGGFDADALAWYGENSRKASHPVAQKKANELGLYDMSGNVWEWCWDWYAPYPSAAQADPSGPGESTGVRVMRGGAWFTPPQLMRSTSRFWSNVYFKANTVGFRLVRNAAPAVADGFQVRIPTQKPLGFYDLLAHPSRAGR